MSNEDMGVRILKDTGYTAARVGAIIFPPAMLREQLVKRGIAEPVEAVSKTSILRRGK